MALLDNYTLRMDNRMEDVVVEEFMLHTMGAERTKWKYRKEPRGLVAGIRKQATHSMPGNGQTDMRDGQGIGRVTDEMKSTVMSRRDSYVATQRCSFCGQGNEEMERQINKINQGNHSRGKVDHEWVGEEKEWMKEGETAQKIAWSHGEKKKGNKIKLGNEGACGKTCRWDQSDLLWGDKGKRWVLLSRPTRTHGKF